MKSFFAMLAGFVFAIGLGIGGMTRPSKVLGFLDLGGTWDPSLLFVMAGGVLVYAVGYRLVRRRSAPLLDTKFYVPAHAPIDRKLLIGAATFGVGWGLAGYCPGPALTAVATGTIPALTFAGAMLAGMGAYTLFERRGSGVARIKDRLSQGGPHADQNVLR